MIRKHQVMARTLRGQLRCSIASMRKHARPIVTVAVPTMTRAASREACSQMRLYSRKPMATAKKSGVIQTVVVMYRCQYSGGMAPSKRSQ